MTILKIDNKYNVKDRETKLFIRPFVQIYSNERSFDEYKSSQDQFLTTFKIKCFSKYLCYLKLFK